ncbi:MULTISPECIES: DUF305 domain-containing protein [Roseobacteraceae]|uniref:DUF305 domain-containing protein n=1 Tax=Pseudosulfitobacter pseudonitzschiae TaxID=1402135 RepID=A0A221K3Q9_9RHOB|nr:MULTISPECIES: DUF305 domain-containing protein [Roseobacteraceae]ASM73644.1 hypothetical protein SULPSESMR1_02863 [Pseudosulfitobacter pseudonitzschiae]
MSHYTRFFAMILTSSAVMFVAMYFNTYAFDHVYFSETRAWMAVYMGALMMAVMLLFMWGMYPSRSANIGIIVVSAVLFGAGLWGVRSQQTVDQIDWMQAMIPHHSIAILTSERAHITDPRVRELANGIIAAQRKEINEMQALITDLKE